MGLINDLQEVCRKVYNNGFVSACDGNISTRTFQGTFLITRSAVSKGDVLPQDILEIDKTGKIIRGSGKVSTEHKLHLELYNRRPDIKAVVHCHPKYATAFATAGVSLDIPVNPEVILTLGRIVTCKYATPSTDELPQSLHPFIDWANCFLLENHGAVTAGKSLKEAYHRMEKLEHYAETFYLARMLGGPKQLPENKLRELYSIAEKSYGIVLSPNSKYIRE